METIKTTRKAVVVQPIQKIEAMHVQHKVPVMTAYPEGDVIIIEKNYGMACEWSPTEVRAWAKALLELADQVENDLNG